MPEIVFVNLEKSETEFLECVKNERRELRKALQKLPQDDRPTISFSDSTSPNGIYNAIVSATRILHLAGHGQYLGRISSTSSVAGHKINALSSFASYLESRDDYLDVDCVILDSCFSAGFPWRYQLARVLAPNRNMTVIGASLKVSYPETEEFFASFYRELLSKKLPVGQAALGNRIANAFDQAQMEFREIHHKYSRMRISILKNS